MLKNRAIDFFDEYGMNDYIRWPCVHEKCYKETKDKTIFGSEDFIFANNSFAELNKDKSLNYKLIILNNCIVIPSE